MRVRLKTQPRSNPPTAISGASLGPTARTPVARSGSDATAASGTRPAREAAGSLRIPTASGLR
jgi:hypothetical protein